MAQGADQAEEAMDCDAEFKTEGHPFIGLEIRVVDDDQASSVGKVTGWLSAAESDYLGHLDGQPAALFHVTYTAGALAGAEEDMELYEVVDSITAVPFTAPDEGQQKQLRELRDQLEAKKSRGNHNFRRNAGESNRVVPAGKAKTQS